MILSSRSVALALAASALLVACGDDGEEDVDGGQGGESSADFVSDNPSGLSGGRGEGGATSSGGDGEESGDAGTSGAGAPDEDGGADPGDDGSRDVAEADIIAVEGDKLYALSRYGGLTIVDISNPGQLPVLGRFRANASPFEMYVENGQVFVMLADFGRYVFDEEGEYSWQTQSRLLALDASNPAAIVERGSFDLPGRIQDSRRVGDVLYLVTHQDGWCWRCEDYPNTTVTSLDVSNPAQVVQVDVVNLPAHESWSYQRSVTATDERLYIAGPEYDYYDTDASHSTISVVDIADPSGIMHQGASVAVAGQITSRWQMDEYEGVLRVVSQPWQWDVDEPPTIETFSVASATQIAPLASVPMVLPRPESLQAVRFDGERGYAITFERTDPLFTLDLSDPAAPRQVGELEIPGWVYHMETRGDRVLGLGFDPENPNGAINVSLFDVSDFANPVMLDREHFGGDWAYFAEDQDRVHKSFQILDQLGLLLIPFWGYEWDVESCGGSDAGGVQLIDWANDALALRGLAPSKGGSRRALVHRDHLIGVSDTAVETFDISNRDAPVALAMQPLSTTVHKVAAADGLVARLSQSWWSEHVELEIASAMDAGTPEPLGSIDLTAALAEDQSSCWYGWYDVELVMRAGFVYVVRNNSNGYYHYYYDDGNPDPSSISVIDVREPAAPVYVGSFALPEVDQGERHYPRYVDSLYGGVDEKNVALVGASIVFDQAGYRELPTGEVKATSTLTVVGLTDPARPAVAAVLQRDDADAMGSLQVHGEALVSWHMNYATPDGSKVRYYLDRIDVTNPSTARILPPVNVPGAVVAYNAAAGRAITVDQHVSANPIPEEQCWNMPGAIDFYEASSGCVILRRDLNLVAIEGKGARLIDTIDIEDEITVLSRVTSSDSRVFVQLQRGTYGYAEDGSSTSPMPEVAVFDPWVGDSLNEPVRIDLSEHGWWSYSSVAIGTQLFMEVPNGLVRLDATNAAAPTMTPETLYGYWCNGLVHDETNLYCALGEYGLQTLPL